MKKKASNCLIYYYNKGNKQVHFQSKRFSYEYFKGDITDKSSVYQTCGDLFCINPDHLRLKTFSESIKEHIKIHGSNQSGKKRSKKTRSKMSLSQMGKKHSEKTKLKMRDLKLGVKRKKEVLEIMSKASRGTNNAMAKLTEDDIRQIRYYHHKLSITQIATMFSISLSHTKSIIYRRSWKHI